MTVLETLKAARQKLVTEDRSVTNITECPFCELTDVQKPCVLNVDASSNDIPFVRCMSCGAFIDRNTRSKQKLS